MTRPGWRSGDLPWFLLLPVMLVVAGVVLALAGTGVAGVVIAAAVLAICVGLVVDWSAAPLPGPPEPPRSE